MFGAAVAAGAGLHVAALDIEGESELGAVGTLATVAIPAAKLTDWAGVAWDPLTVKTRSTATTAQASPRGGQGSNSAPVAFDSMTSISRTADRSSILLGGRCAAAGL